VSRRLVFALLATCAVSVARSQTQTGSAQPPLPQTGADYSAVDQFYVVADILAKDAEPTDAQWNAMFATPGYRLVANHDRGFRQKMTIALKPSLAPSRDSVLRADPEAAVQMRHLIRAYGLRSELLKIRRDLETSVADSIARSIRAAARFLPAGTTAGRNAPFLGFAIFAYDNYPVGGGVLMDVLYTKENGLVAILSHEFHHVYLSYVDKIVPPVGPVPEDVPLAIALISLRNEGIADQIDKPHPLPLRGNALDGYIKRYNDIYARTPQILRSIDSLLVVVADTPSVVRAAGTKAGALLWASSHPNGAYIARTIVETFGIDSLMPAVYNPFALFRTYAAAEKKRGNPPPFSAKAITVLDQMEKHYVRP
jgi:hypothetical protein